MAKAKKKAKANKAPKDKVASLAQRREKIRARYGTPVVIYADDPEPPRVVTRFSRFNGLVGGGLKRGAIIELFGPEDSGKTSLGVALAADVQAASPPGRDHVVMINYEIPQDYLWWSILGLKVDKDHFTQLRPRTLEEGIADAVDLTESGEVCAWLVDSVYAASAKAAREIMKTWADPKKGGSTGGGIAVEARQWGAAWTAVKGLFSEHDMVCIAVNQERIDLKAGQGGPKSWMPKTTTPRGKALKFYSWLRLELYGSALVDEDKKLRTDVDGRRVRVKVIKNKTSDDQRGLVYYDLIRGYGFDLIGDLIALALEAGAIKAGGGGYYTIGRRRLQGKAKLRDLVESSERIQRVLREYVKRWMVAQALPDDEEEMS